MKTVLVLVSLALVAAAPSAGSIDNYIAPRTVDVPPTNISKYLAHRHRAILNFACNVDRITVTPNFDQFSAGVEDPLTQVELEDHLGEPSNIEWAHVLQMYFKSVDPRGQERQLGTLGGDLGEYALVMAAVEQELGREFTADEVLKEFKTYLTVMSREKFYFSIDTAGIEFLKKACGCPQLNIADPPDSKKAILTNATHKAGAHGDEFFKKILADPGAYQLRRELIEHVVDAFFTVMWDKADPLHRRIKFVLLKGELDPKGFIMIKTPGYCNAQLLAPMISPELCSKQMGIYHGDAAVLLRTEMAGIALIRSPEMKNGAVRKANELASNALSTMLADHTEPIYTVGFEGF